MKLLKIALKLSKYLLLFVIIITILLIIAFFNYSKNLNYKIPDKQTIVILDKNGNSFFEINNANKQSYVPLNEISDNIIKAFIAIEDKDFYKHNGFSIKRICGALIKNFKNNSISEGASTITQQYVKNLFLSSEKTYERKIKEIAIAINLETKYTKDEILEGYLNTIYFGHGIYGINDACRYYFNKKPNEISLSEACVIAAIPKGPSIYSPINNFEKNKERKELILNELEKDKIITNYEKEKALKENINLNIKQDSIKVAPFYQDIVINELQKLNIKSTIPYYVYTNVDINLNNFINKTINKYIPESNLEISIMALDPSNGNVLSIIGSKNYANSSYNRATNALRQPGSAIKPFLYYSALENGFTPITTFSSFPTSFNVNGSIYEPHNYKDIYPNQDVTMAYALATSDNIYAVKTHLFLGTETLYNTLKDFGFSTTINNNPSLALGTSEVYLDELILGYGKIASLGKNIETNYINKIVDINGKVLYEKKYDIKQKYDYNNCYILAETMTNMFDNNLSINISVTGATIKSMLTNKYAGKSGSTDSDNWMIGFNNNLVLGIWCGYDDNRVLQNSEGKFIKYIWAEIMEYYNQNKEKKWYDTPNNVISIKLNPINGQLAINNEYSKSLFFNTNNIPWHIFDLDKRDINQIKKP